MNKLKCLLISGICLSSITVSHAQSFKNTYIREALVAENKFRTVHMIQEKPRSFDVARKVLPVPFWDGHSEEIQMYWDAWKLATKNICLHKKVLDLSLLISLRHIMGIYSCGMMHLLRCFADMGNVSFLFKRH